ncbi:MAG: PEP-CTERM sorting domain-containing protein, partial [Planctomycetota bacterium]
LYCAKVRLLSSRDNYSACVPNSAATQNPYRPIANLTDGPEPSSLALLGLGGLLIARRRKG